MLDLLKHYTAAEFLEYARTQSVVRRFMEPRRYDAESLVIPGIRPVSNPDGIQRATFTYKTVLVPDERMERAYRDKQVAQLDQLNILLNQRRNSRLFDPTRIAPTNAH